MLVVPVLDLQSGQVVRGVAGRRHEYRPVQSLLCDDARPASVATAFVERLGLDTAYVADLDAIAGGEPAFDAYRTLCECGLRLWIDAGTGDARRAREMAEFANACAGIAGIVAGLESLPDLAALREAFATVGPERFIFSLDLKHGRPWTSSRGWQGRSAEQIGEAALALGARKMIVLDIAQVGGNAGVADNPFVATLRERWPDVTLIGGGGVRGREDLRKLAAAEFDAALVATALHNGQLTKEDWQPGVL